MLIHIIIPFQTNFITFFSCVLVLADVKYNKYTTGAKCGNRIGRLALNSIKGRNDGNHKMSGKK